MVNPTVPTRRPQRVAVTWRLPVGVASILLYFVKQLRAYPTSSAAAEDALRQAVERHETRAGR